ncbi:hypothetical protein AYO21_05972 [Fonsecaea monophora]|uniref:Methyltransferase domain-containing protein n=1 Tax=Fonsecaea monophora TaxID=254056 RepID=A0A177F657_9EURO|nr:hypothetical protein AYO21_05972 [Fonsecaea monophora]OAG39697.1 hypothetical protein AYO21_05972 [Fonsecaea monophora]
MSDTTKQSPEHSLEPGAIVEQPAAPDPDAEIQPDSNEPSDVDSTLGDDATAASTSLASSVYKYHYEHGRRYHAYRQGAYTLPNDELEQARLDLLHHVFRLTLDGRLFRAPILASPQRVLDFGTGTGIWAVDFADEFPMASVIGTDLSPIQPDVVPPNVRFYVDDVESDWVEATTEAERYDFIHGRTMVGSIKDWDRLYQQALRSLNPGGWLEMQEYETHLKSDDDPELTRVPYLKRWQDEVNEGSKVFGKDLDVAKEQRERMSNAGFVDVRDDIYKVPVGVWPRDPKLKTLGKYQLGQVCSAIEPFALGFLTRYRGWSEDECRVLVAHVLRELQDFHNHLYVNFHFVLMSGPYSSHSDAELTTPRREVKHWGIGLGFGLGP